jgi:hypothetical protein
MKSIVTLVFIFLTSLGFGQSYISLYNFNHINQNLLVNPASPHKYKLVVGIPGIGGLSTHINSNNFASILDKNGDPNENLSNAINGLTPKSRINTAQSLEGIFVGFATGQGYWTITAQQKTDFNMTLPGNLFRFLYNGNSAYIGETVDFSNFNIEAIVRNEYGIGYQHKIDSNLIIGGRYKFISGVSNIYTQRFNASIYSDIENVSFNSDILINTSGLFNSFIDGDQNFDPVSYYSGNIFGENTGMSFDLGAYYRINKRFDVSASVLNLGWIKWKKDLKGIEAKGGFEFDGVKGDYPYDIDFGDYLDSVISDVEYNEISINSYSTSLPAHFIVSGQFYANEKNVFGLLYQGSIWNNNLYSNYGVMYNGRYSKWFNLMLGYSVIDNTLNNMTLGLSLRLGAFQIYALTDNTFGFLNPSKIVATNVRAGITLSFLDKPKKSKSKKESKSEN